MKKKNKIVLGSRGVIMSKEYYDRVDIYTKILFILFALLIFTVLLCAK